MNVDRANQRVGTALTAARTARKRIEEAIAALRRGPEFEMVDAVAEELGQSLTSLFRAETGGMAHVRKCVGIAMEHLGTALANLHSTAPAHASVEEVSLHIARSLSLLFPARREVDEGLASRDEREPALPLGRRRTPRRETVSPPAPAEDMHSLPNVLAIGTRVRVSLALSSGHRVETDGRVAWVREPVDLSSDLHPGMGVVLENLDEVDRRAILSFMKQRAPLFYDS